jgi:hypothetical protein
MKQGFSVNLDQRKLGKAGVLIDDNELDKLMKKYKNIKKYMKSPLYQVKVMDGTEKLVSNLIKENEQDPI